MYFEITSGLKSSKTDNIELKDTKSPVIGPSMHRDIMENSDDQNTYIYKETK